ncbi:MAG: hypothetical protein KC425_19160, partial [Anaerolineales bacterium]|nr:hypothetical protein [Anaerolineales bacterium]
MRKKDSSARDVPRYPATPISEAPTQLFQPPEQRAQLPEAARQAPTGAPSAEMPTQIWVPA